MSPHRGLFRRQALLQQQAPRFGAVLLARPPGAVFFVPLAIGVLSGVSALLFASHTRTVMVGGTLRPLQGVVQVVATQSGTVAQRAVADGERVRTGAALFVLANERSSASGDATRAAALQLQVQRDSLRADQHERQRQYVRQRQALQAQLDGLHAGQTQLLQQMQLQQQRVELAEVTAERYLQLQQQGFIAALQWQDRHAELLDQRQRLAELQRALSVNRQQLAAAQLALQDRAAQVAREQQALLRELAAIEAQLSDSESRRELIIRAPISGVVDAVTVERGQSVAVNQVLAALLPEASPLEAELQVPATAAGFLRRGAVVTLRYDAYAWQKFGQQRGVIREISRTTLPGGASTPVYRVRVTLEHQSITAYGQPMPLKPGMSLQAGIQLERRRLYQWLLNPLYSLRGVANGA